MPQYDLYPSPAGRGFLLDVQSDLLGALNTRVVVPLLPEDEAPVPARRLNPIFDIAGVRHVMATQFMSAIQTRHLAAPSGSLADKTDEITAAIDMLTHGF